MLKDWLRVTEQGVVEVQKIDLDGNTPYWERMFAEELSSMEIGHLYDIPFELKEILMKYIMLADGDGLGAIRKFEVEAKLYLEGKLKVFIDCEECEYKEAYKELKKDKTKEITRANQLKSEEYKRKPTSSSNTNLGINNKKPVKTDKTVPESDFVPENLFVLSGWIAGKKKLPEKIEGTIIDERPKALRIRHRDGDFWTPKSAVQVKSLPKVKKS